MGGKTHYCDNSKHYRTARRGKAFTGKRPVSHVGCPGARAASRDGRRAGNQAFSALPGSAILRCICASTASGMMPAKVACTLFMNPDATCRVPVCIAS